MAKHSDKQAGAFDVGEAGGMLSGLLAEEDELDRRALWRLGAWAAGAVGAVVIAILANQSTIDMRRDLTSSADFARQAQQIQLSAKDSQNETRRLASAVETLNGDRDRLYSRVAALEQGLDSVTGAITRQAPVPAPPPPQASAPVSAPPSASSSSSAASASSAVASANAAAAAGSPSAEPPPVVSPKPSPAPIVSAAAPTAPIPTEKPSPKPAATAEPSAAQTSSPAPAQPPPAQAVASLVAPKSMMAPPDPAATKLSEPSTSPKTITSAPMPDLTASVPKTSDDEAAPETPSVTPELAVRRTEFGVDVGGANSIPGLRALWRGLLKSRTNVALTTMRPIIVIKENSNGLGMQLRLVAGPISDAATAAKVCATLTVNDRKCTTAVFEGQRLAMNTEEQVKSDAAFASDAALASDAKPNMAPKSVPQKRVTAKRPPKEEPPKEEPPSTFSLIFGRH
ncbi:MAG TPA: hypothetical protein VKT76_01125 [Bradyrhizobium sp.]|nr:hypothetical protein [Bradyrhizobium sp.]